MDKYDPRYQRGKIYTITCEDGAIYVGSTIQELKRRFTKHPTQRDCSLYYYINNNYNGDWSKCKIELYENYPSNNKIELEKKEGEITKLIGTINMDMPGNNYNRQEYEKHRKNIKERNEIMKQIIICDCGLSYIKRHKARHKKTKRHQDLMDKQTSAILSFLECF